MRVAQKFQDLAFNATGYGKSAMIKRSNYYLRKAAKSTKKEEHQVQERIELMRLLNKALFHGHKKIIMELEKSYKDVAKSNKSIRNFILYLCNYYLEDEAGMDNSLEYLKNSPNSNYYEERIEVLNDKKRG